MRLRVATCTAAVALLLTAACSADPSNLGTPSGPASSAEPTARASGADSGSPTIPDSDVSEIPEPTTTNTLPPPRAPTKAAPSTAGDLSAKSLPVPAGWRTIARAGGEEDGYLGNGTWVHARDPRYAAFDVITIGCSAVTRDDYTDPTTALEGTYARHSEPGIGLVLEFATASDATTYFDLYRQQVDACRGDGGPVQIRVLDSDTGLIDQRTYPDGDWTEIGKLVDRRVTMIILSDPGHGITAGQAESVLAAVR